MAARMRLVSMGLAGSASVVGVIVTLWGCGGALGAGTADGGAPGAGTMDAPAPDGSVGRAALFQSLYPGQPDPQAPGFGYEVVQCLTEALPIRDSGLPNCIVVSAGLLPQSEDGGSVDRCGPCDAAGLEPFTSSIPLDQIGEGLAAYPCLCAVAPLPVGSGCPPIDLFPDPDASYDSRASWWCYGQPGDSLPADNRCAPRPGQFLGFSGAATGSGTLYVACFAQTAP